MQGQDLPVKRAERTDPGISSQLSALDYLMKTSKLCRRIAGKQQNMIGNPGSAEKIFPEYKSKRLSLALLDIALVLRGRTKVTL
jgi:hypothetical protein